MLSPEQAAERVRVPCATKSTTAIALHEGSKIADTESHTDLGEKVPPPLLRNGGRKDVKLMSPEHDDSTDESEEGICSVH